MSDEEDYEVLDHLGQGTFGLVQKVRRIRDNQTFACKTIGLARVGVSAEDVQRECLILRQLSHPNIVAYHDYQIVQQPNLIPRYTHPTHCVKLFMEYCSEGSLQDLINHQQFTGRNLISESLVWNVFHQLAKALQYCHYGVADDGQRALTWQPILHRDIKPANVLIATRSEDHLVVKLADFGVATTIDPERPPASYVGTRQYQPPEITRFSERKIRWTKSCDIFSLGATIFTLCALEAPFSYRMDEDDECPDLPDTYSGQLSQIVRNCQALDAHRRPDAFEVGDLCARFRDSTQSPSKYSSVRQQEFSLTPRTTDRSVDSTLRETPTESLDPPLSSSDNKLSSDVIMHALREAQSAMESRSYAVAHRMLQDIKLEAFEVLGRNHKTIAEFLACFGRAQHRLHDFESAENTLQEATDTYIRVSGLEDVETTNTLHSLGVAQYDREKYSTAERTFQTAFNIQKRVSGVEHIQTTITLRWLGKTQYRRKNFIVATQTLQEAYDTQKKVIGPKRGETIETLFWLGKTQYESADYVMAEQNLQEAYEVRRERLGAEHEKTIDVLYSIGKLQYAKLDYPSAERTLQEVCIIERSVLGAEHRNRAESLRWLGKAQFRLGMIDEAQENFKAALRVAEITKGAESPSAKESIKWLNLTHLPPETKVNAKPKKSSWKNLFSK